MKGTVFMGTNLTEKNNMFQWDAGYKIIPKGHPTGTIFSKLSVWRSKYCLEFSSTRRRRKISR